MVLITPLGVVLRHGQQPPQWGAPSIDTAYQRWRRTQARFDMTQRSRRNAPRRPPPPRSAFTPHRKPPGMALPPIQTITAEERASATKAASARLTRMLTNSRRPGMHVRTVPTEERVAYELWKKQGGAASGSGRSLIAKRRDASNFARFRIERQRQIAQEEFIRKAQEAIAAERIRSAIHVVPYAPEILPPTTVPGLAPGTDRQRSHFAPPDTADLERMIAAREKLGLRGIYL